MKAHTRNEMKFTIRTANQTLPLVKMIVQDIVALSREVSETRERLELLAEGRNDNGREDEYSRELNSIEQTTELKSDRVNQFIEELIDLKVGASSVTQGFVDFAATRENESVLLCWHLEDEEVMYWHRHDETCCLRRPVDLLLIGQASDRRCLNLA